MSEARITILMMPPQECSPNAREHWARKASAIANAREQAGWAAREALNNGAPNVSAFCGNPRPVIIDIEVAWHRRRTMDRDNLIASCKAMIDGISDVLWGGRDDRIHIGEVRQLRGKGTTTLILRDAA